MTPYRSTFLRLPACRLAIITLLLLAGCEGREPIEIPEAKVEPVTEYGITLDENATPKEVAYVLTRAIADDVKHAKAHDHAGHKEAVDLQFKIAAYSVLERRVLGAMNAHEGPEVKTLDPDRAEKLYEVVKQWGAIAAHYVSSFADNFEDAANRMEVENKSADTANVYYEVSHDPDASAEEERQPATLKFELHKEKSGNKSYWRVARVDFKRPPVPEPATQPATTTQPSRQ